jgi:putative DNA primase/helicase
MLKPDSYTVEHLAPDESPPISPDAPRPPAFSDDALALRFADRHESRLRFVVKWSAWLAWNSSHWKFEDTLLAFDYARILCREAAGECNEARVATAIAGAKTVAAVERLAKSDRRLAAVIDQWDTDPWLLNTPAGTVDLRTGKTGPHRIADHITKIAGVAPDSSCPIPIWMKFLERVTGHDPDLIAFLWRVSGYALTGSTKEHALFFLYGVGAIGKSTFLDTVTGCAGDYHRTAPIETFTASGGDRHPTDLAGLRGARLVTAVETEEGRRWAESRIKTLTGATKSLPAL